jgi:hypothetical protein
MPIPLPSGPALWRGVRELSPRTLVSVFRTLLYGGVAALFALTQAEATQLLDGVVLGAVLADYVTWFLRSAVQLPANLLHGCYEAGVNMLFAWLLFRAVDFRITDDGSTVAVAFLAFMLVLGVKAAYYGVQSVQRNLEED